MILIPLNVFTGSGSEGSVGCEGLGEEVGSSFEVVVVSGTFVEDVGGRDGVSGTAGGRGGAIAGGSTGLLSFPEGWVGF